MRRLILAFLLLSIAAFAKPVSIACPQDGQAMFYDHMVGYGESAVCWYSHNAWQDGKSVKHEAYISCPNGE